MVHSLRKIERKWLIIIKKWNFNFLLFSVKIKNMEDVNAIFRQFKRSSENCHLNIEYGLIECYKHSTEKNSYLFDLQRQPKHWRYHWKGEIWRYCQKQPFRSVVIQRCSKNMQQIYRKIPMSKCDFNKAAK